MRKDTALGQSLLPAVKEFENTFKLTALTKVMAPSLTVASRVPVVWTLWSPFLVEVNS